MSWWSGKSVSRREQIRKDRPDTAARKWEHLRTSGVVVSLQIAAVFWVVATTILMLRDDVVPYRPGQYTHHDILSRVDFTYMDKEALARAQATAVQTTPRVYTRVPDAWKALEDKLTALPDRVAAAATPNELGADLRGVLDSGSFTALKAFHPENQRPTYLKQVQNYLARLKSFDPARPEQTLIIIPDAERSSEMESPLTVISLDATDADGAPATAKVRSEVTLSPAQRGDIQNRVARLAEVFDLVLQPKIVALTMANLKETFRFDEGATTEAQNRAAAMVNLTQGQVIYQRNRPLVPKNVTIDDRYWQLLKAENDHYVRSLDHNRLKQLGGIAGIVAIVTVMLCVYVARYQPKIVRKHPRAAAMVALMLAMLLIAQIAGIGTSPLFIFGLAPTILVAMILTIVYDPRFAMGLATLHAVLVSVALGQGLSFFIILFAGVMTCCQLLDDIRTRSKLIEIGGAAALAMMAATVAAGLINMDPLVFVGKNCLYSGAAGLATGFVVLGILPFIEKTFRITTSMTLLELADASHPLLRRLQMEAPGTYSHSLQVATIAEACADAIGQNSLLCRVASYYHDVGKINKPDYFCENQSDGVNRHMNLSPSVSLLIIIGHVKDGVELAKEYSLPTSILPFIQQHHGTTLVEFFYYQACTKQESDQPAISEVQYRYPGPRPRTKEIAIVMVADAVESATRAMQDPSASRIEALVHDIIMKRLLDGQFDDCDLTMRELQQIERTCVKALLSIYHGRIAYPSSVQIQGAAAAASGTVPAVRSA